MRKIDSKIHLIFACLLLVNIFLWANYFKPQKTTVSVLSVGQGDAILVQDGYTQVLVDGGPGSKVTEKLSGAMPELDRTIELVVITHFDKDHYEGIFDVVKKYKIGAVAYHEPEVQKEGAQDLIDLLNDKKIPIIKPVAGQNITVGELNLDVLNPFLGEVVKGNDRGIVLKATREYSALLTGDVGFKSLKLMKQNEATLLKSDFLKVPHHGSKNNLTAEFLEFVRPQATVISVGKNGYGHPSVEALDLLKTFPVFRTDQNGTAVFDLRTGVLSFRH